MRAAPRAARRSVRKGVVDRLVSQPTDRLGDPDTLVDFTPVAADALADPWSWADRWAARIDGLTEAGLDVAGFGQYPRDLDPQLPFIGIFWRMDREFIHHLSEVVLLRCRCGHQSSWSSPTRRPDHLDLTQAPVDTRRHRQRIEGWRRRRIHLPTVSAVVGTDGAITREDTVRRLPVRLPVPPAFPVIGPQAEHSGPDRHPGSCVV